MLRQKCLVWCISFLLIPTLLGCSTTYSVIHEEKRVAHFDVESDPSNLNVYVNSESKGKSPATVEVPYVETEKKAEPGGKKTGLWVMILGAIGVGAGGVLAAWGAGTMGSSDAGSAGLGVLGLVYGGVIAVCMLPVLIGGIYLYATTKTPPNLYEVTPSNIQVGVNIPGVGMQEAKLSPVNSSLSPKFDELKRSIIP